LRELELTATASGAALVSLCAVAAFSVLLVIAHVVKPEISPSWRLISEYEIGRYGWIMRLAFVCWSTSVFAVWPALRLDVPPSLGSAALFLVALGPLGAAIFATEAITTLPGSTGVCTRPSAHCSSSASRSRRPSLAAASRGRRGCGWSPESAWSCSLLRR
jgi:hypothetical protein